MCDKLLPLWWLPDRAQEVVVVHDNVDGGVGEQRYLVQGLPLLQSEPAHDCYDGVVEDMQERHGLAFQC